ncbi:hypothetical protein L226DRAFT_146479 [Lentinus tigrinus ALCF2SS1-7]|uniref:uncharacterized protein n=1 Tax=Lentinus tigrinus ALCF2SS1-7 TaxID=1328758 RepID=UPI001165DC52|nr:hypothetical protein L226DRAFT_146479 [Lentinus tigrinus ALCF2SS1-7]
MVMLRTFHVLTSPLMVRCSSTLFSASYYPGHTWACSRTRTRSAAPASSYMALSVVFGSMLCSQAVCRHSTPDRPSWRDRECLISARRGATTICGPERLLRPQAIQPYTWFLENLPQDASSPSEPEGHVAHALVQNPIVARRCCRNAIDRPRHAPLAEVDMQRPAVAASRDTLAPRQLPAHPSVRPMDEFTDSRLVTSMAEL